MILKVASVTLLGSWNLRPRLGNVTDLAQFAPEKIAIWREIIAPPEKAGRGAPLSLRIREIELAASAAWPAAEQVRMGDWLLRATGKLTFRANSVLPLGEPPYGNPGKPLQEAIDEVVAFYQERQLTPVFHIPYLHMSNLMKHWLYKAGRKKFWFSLWSPI